jgi:hypothetical protein
LINWCKEDAINRYTTLSKIIRPFVLGDEYGFLEWSSLAKKLINNSLKPIEVLNIFFEKHKAYYKEYIQPETGDSDLVIFKYLLSNTNNEIIKWAKKAELLCKKEIEKARFVSESRMYEIE